MIQKTLHLLLCLAAATLPFWVPSVESSSALSAFPGWPSSFEGRPLEPLGLDEAGQDFESGFPGKLGVFGQGPRRIVLHWIATPTRAFHFSGLCLKGQGWTLKARPREVGPDGESWAVREAKRGTDQAKLRQRIVDAKGKIFYDESAWYWATLWGETTGPWMAWTVVEPVRS